MGTVDVQTLTVPSKILVCIPLDQGISAVFNEHVVNIVGHDEYVQNKEGEVIKLPSKEGTRCQI
jgi:hypothetical protein